ncbi:hypothetical protein ACFYM3_01585 [Streptomyces massasporeus]|uniref:Uncharacterized protein n=1 Tax=Streptomyces massasporeus TaxID=67324 RepID=A0ABW6L7E5_9ACTN
MRRTAAAVPLLTPPPSRCDVDADAAASRAATGTGERYDPFEPEDTPTVGDEALAHRGVITHGGGTPRPVRTSVVRHDDVIAVCTAVGGARSASPTLLTPVIGAQDARLR